MKIDLRKECAKKTVTRGDGEVINKLLLNAWNSEDRIIIDFGNISIASVSFLDEAFGKLAFNYSKEKLVEKLSFENIDEYDRALLNDIFLSRYRQKEAGENALSRRRRRNQGQHL